MVKHIGIVGCSSEGAALCYRTICQEGENTLGKFTHPEVSMHTFSFSEYMHHIESGGWEGVGRLMLGSARKLAEAGADFAICPDNTIHQAFEYVEPDSPIPWIHIADAVGEEAESRGCTRLGISGTRFLMEGPVYPSRLQPRNIECEIPDEQTRIRINDIIFDELVYGVFTDEARTYFYSVYSEFKDKGCDAAVMGCTEIPLLVVPGESPIPVLDSTRLLARAALKKAAANS